MSLAVVKIMVERMDENKKDELTQSTDIFDDFKNSAKKSEELSEITSGDSPAEKHSKSSAQNAGGGKIAAIILGFFSTVFFLIKKCFKRENAKILIAVFAILAILLVSYFVFLRKSPDQPSSDPKKIAETYVKGLAVYDYSAIENIELIKTKEHYEKLESKDFSSYVENMVSSDSEIYGKDPKIEIKDIKISDIAVDKRGLIGYYLKNGFNIKLTDKELQEGKTAVVKLKKSGNETSNDIEYTLYLIKAKTDDDYTWKVINSENVNKYAEIKNISVSQANDFAAQGDDFWK